MRKNCSDLDSHSRPQSPRSFWPVAGIDPCYRPEGSWVLGTRRMDSKKVEKSATGRVKDGYYLLGNFHRISPRQGDLENLAHWGFTCASMAERDWVKRQKAIPDLLSIWKTSFYSSTVKTRTFCFFANPDGDTSCQSAFSFWAFFKPGLNSRNVTHFLVMFL